MQIINIKKELGGSYTYRRRRMSSIIFINPGRHHKNTPQNTPQTFKNHLLSQLDISNKPRRI